MNKKSERIKLKGAYENEIEKRLKFLMTLNHILYQSHLQNKVTSIFLKL